jgi:hypothetical protein
MTPAGRNRAASAGLVGLYVAAAGIALPDEARRGALHYLVVATIGWGHLLGSLRLGRVASRSALRAACLAVALANALLLYLLALERWPALVLGMLAISVWHAAENDAALEQAYANGHRLGPPSRSTGARLAGAGPTLLVVALAGGALPPAELGPLLAASPLVAAAPALAAAGAATAGLALVAGGERRRLGLLLAGAGSALCAFGAPSALAFADVFAAASLHHLVSWLLLLAGRARADSREDPGRARLLLRRVAAAHAAPVLVLWLLPLAGPGAAALRTWLLAPPLYLFASLLHVAYTARLRGAGASAR